MAFLGGDGSSCECETFSWDLSLYFGSIEGALTIGIAVIGYWIVLNFPDSILASGKKGYFTQAELAVVLDRVERDRGDSLPDKLTWQKFWRHVLSWQLWVYGVMFLCCSAPIYAFTYFIQTILKTMGYPTAVVFLLVSNISWASMKANGFQCAPPYLFSAVWTVIVAWAADKTKFRMPYIVLNTVITLIGLLLTAYCKVSRSFGLLSKQLLTKT